MRSLTRVVTYMHLLQLFRMLVLSTLVFFCHLLPSPPLPSPPPVLFQSLFACFPAVIISFEFFLLTSRTLSFLREQCDYILSYCAKQCSLKFYVQCSAAMPPSELPRSLV